jgi:hypothetical protein
MEMQGGAVVVMKRSRPLVIRGDAGK